MSPYIGESRTHNSSTIHVLFFLWSNNLRIGSFSNQMEKKKHEVLLLYFSSYSNGGQYTGPTWRPTGLLYIYFLSGPRIFRIDIAFYVEFIILKVLK